MKNDYVSRQHKSLFIALIAVLICFMFMYFFAYHILSHSIQYKNWDFKTTTAADYTVEFILPPKIYEDWLENKHEDSEREIDEETSTDFKLYFVDKLQHIIG
jgi:hypothetical protein